jgi:DNA-3-methyladenine glycosylase I
MDSVFSHITRTVFESGLGPGVVERRWPAFEQAFAGFEPEAVAAFGSDDVERLLADASIVRNRRKIEATVANAQALVELEAPFATWLVAKDDPERALRERFSGLGASGAARLLETLRHVDVCAAAATG